MEEIDSFLDKLRQIHTVSDELSFRDHDSLYTVAYVKLLERKVSILEDVVNTTHTLAALNCSTISNCDVNQLCVTESVTVGVQTDFDCTNQLEVEYDCLHDVPQSFLVTDSDGVVELPESLLSINFDGLENAEPINPWENNFYENISSACDDFSSICDDFSSISDDHDTSNTDLSDFLYNLGSGVCDDMGSATAQTANLGEPCNSDIIPVQQMDDSPFHKFSLETLLDELDFSHKFGNRSAIYFGEFDYNYNGGHHKAKDMPSQSYLASITSYLDVLYPSYEYNSALVNYYQSGEDYIPSHSDDEDSIEDESCIMTVSLGTTRVLQVREIASNNVVQTLELKHGDVYAMSKKSQKLFAHEIVRDPSIQDHRVSITFRLIKKTVEPEGFDIPFSEDKQPAVLRSYSPILSDFDSDASGHVPFPSLPSNEPPEKLRNKVKHSSLPPRASSGKQVDTVYISSSMFRNLDPSLLSSVNQRALVFFYPGANSTQMIERLTKDPEFKKLNKDDVRKVFLLTGTNYVDSISSGYRDIESAKHGIELISFRLWEIFTSAKMHIINILPREAKVKNDIIYELNSFIWQLCCTHGLSFIDTEFKNRLFSSRGIRKSSYFKKNHNDDVHLNTYGIARLGRHLKYLAHL